MPDIFLEVEIPNRALFKAAEVCDILKVQPYVLRSWEAEFPELGVSKAAGAPRFYRRKDVEQVARIKHMLLVEGLTLAGARRKLEEEAAPIEADAAALEELMGRNARERLTTIKRGLRSILELLSADGTPFHLSAETPRVRSIAAARGRTAKPARGKPPAAKHASSRAARTGRKA